MNGAPSPDAPALPGPVRPSSLPSGREITRWALPGVSPCAAISLASGAGESAAQVGIHVQPPGVRHPQGPPGGLTLFGHLPCLRGGRKCRAGRDPSRTGPSWGSHPVRPSPLHSGREKVPRRSGSMSNLQGFVTLRALAGVLPCSAISLAFGVGESAAQVGSRPFRVHANGRSSTWTRCTSSTPWWLWLPGPVRTGSRASA